MRTSVISRILHTFEVRVQPTGECSLQISCLSFLPTPTSSFWSTAADDDDEGEAEVEEEEKEDEVVVLLRGGIKPWTNETHMTNNYNTIGRFTRALLSYYS